jgi:hypothetical protein
LDSKISKQNKLLNESETNPVISGRFHQPIFTRRSPSVNLSSAQSRKAVISLKSDSQTVFRLP